MDKKISNRKPRLVSNPIHRKTSTSGRDCLKYIENHIKKRGSRSPPGTFISMQNKVADILIPRSIFRKQPWKSQRYRALFSVLCRYHCISKMRGPPFAWQLLPKMHFWGFIPLTYRHLRCGGATNGEPLQISSYISAILKSCFA
jgi:hypothetical protein